MFICFKLFQYFPPANFLIVLTGKHHGLSLRSSIDHRRVVLERLKWVNQWLEDKLPLGQRIIVFSRKMTKC